MSERITMTVNVPKPVKAQIPGTGKYVTYEELQAILASYATKEELNNETIMRWGSEEV